MWTPDGEWMPVPYVDEHRAELIYRIYRIYAVDPLTYNRCGGEMKILAFITESSVIRTILNHRDKTDAVPRAPPVHSSV